MSSVVLEKCLLLIATACWRLYWTAAIRSGRNARAWILSVKTMLLGWMLWMMS
tara:strand:- start:1419 stop:1577 length:159 start_codon:yes stop_codon:yes gene_type:complete